MLETSHITVVSFGQLLCKNSLGPTFPSNLSLKNRMDNYNEDYLLGRGKH